MNGELSASHQPARVWLHRSLQGRPFGSVAIVLAILGVALAMRSYGLTYHSLWFDEVMSTVWASRPADQIWQVGMALTQDKHPPLYHLLLHYWTTLFGPGDVAVRSLGVLIGALAVLPALGIGATLGGWRAGVLGALFLAINPFLVWYSQEARMFMPATTFILAALYGALLIWDAGRPRRRHLEGYSGAEAAAAGHLAVGPLAIGAVLVVAGFTAALYSYLFSALVLPVAVAWSLLLWWLAARSGVQRSTASRLLVMNLAALAVVVLLFLPLARAAWSVSGQESSPGHAFGGLAVALGRLLRTYSLGWPTWSAQVSLGVAIGVALLTLLGLAAPLGRKPPIVQAPTSGPPPGPLGGAGAGGAVQPGSNLPPTPGLLGASCWMEGWGGLLLALWLALPVGVGGLLLARDRTVFAESRYFIFLVPALCLTWGRGLAWLWPRMASPPGRSAEPGRAERGWGRWRLAGLVGLALTFGVTLGALSADWSAQNRREAWREAAALIESHAGPNDAVVIQPDYVVPALTRYLPASRPIYYPFTQQLEYPAEVDNPLQGLRDYDAVWLVQSHHQELDPRGLVAGWFSARYPLLTEAYPAGIALHAFVQHYRSPDLPAGVPKMNHDFGKLRLLGCVVQPRSTRARDDLYHPPSGWIHVTTYWTAAAPIGEDVYPQVRLVDPAGQIWGEHLRRPGDAIHLWPTSRWQVNEVVRVDYDVNMNPITPPGEYRIQISTSDNGAQASCGEVAVTR